MYSNTLDQSFRRQNRLTTPHDYQTVFRVGHRLSGQHLTILFCPNQLECGRLGLVVSKKQIRTAVARNAVKRAIRESFRMKQHALKGLDVVMIAYKSLANLDKSELRSCIDKQCTRLLKNAPETISPATQKTDQHRDVLVDCTSGFV